MRQYSVRYMEAGLCRRPYCNELGSATMREAHYRIYIHSEGAVDQRPYCAKREKVQEVMTAGAIEWGQMDGGCHPSTKKQCQRACDVHIHGSGDPSMRGHDV